jgi:hypothetical protein
MEVVPAAPWKEVLPLSRVLAGIARDSKTEPENYLDETEVRRNPCRGCGASLMRNY